MPDASFRLVNGIWTALLSIYASTYATTPACAAGGRARKCASTAALFQSLCRLPRSAVTPIWALGLRLFFYKRRKGYFRRAAEAHGEAAGSDFTCAVFRAGLCPRGCRRSPRSPVLRAFRSRFPASGAVPLR